jgi:ribonuclease T1
MRSQPDRTRPWRSWLAALLTGLALCTTAFAQGTVDARDLPPQARQVLSLIHQGGPFKSQRDGVTFSNRERLLPRQSSGYYTEYTVPTPGAHNRGARRIIAGKGDTGDPASSGEYWYTADHYASFQRVRE